MRGCLAGHLQNRLPGSLAIAGGHEAEKSVKFLSYEESRSRLYHEMRDKSSCEPPKITIMNPSLQAFSLEVSHPTAESLESILEVYLSDSVEIFYCVQLPASRPH